MHTTKWFYSAQHPFHEGEYEVGLENGTISKAKFIKGSWPKNLQVLKWRGEYLSLSKPEIAAAVRSIKLYKSDRSQTNKIRAQDSALKLGRHFFGFIDLNPVTGKKRYYRSQACGYYRLAMAMGVSLSRIDQYAFDTALARLSKTEQTKIEAVSISN